MKIKIKNDLAKCPSKGSAFSAGYDLYSIVEDEILPQERKLIPTGIILEIPEGYYGRIAPRSGLALKHGVDVFAGVIDSDYRGEVGVVLYNSDKTNTFSIKKGDRIAQIIFERCFSFPLEIEERELASTNRSSGGFGSTGI
jgi:dUTP pyrophosphatase